MFPLAQASIYLMIKYSKPCVSIFYDPQISRQKREDTKERYSRTVLILSVPWRTVHDLRDANQKREDALQWPFFSKLC
jgi:hypothetical protein